MAILGVTVIGSLGSASVLKGLIAGAFGIWISLIGFNPILGTERFVFTSHLQGGVSIVPALIGLFAIPQVLYMVETAWRGQSGEQFRMESRSIWRSVRYNLSRVGTLTLGSGVGAVVGLIPGAGGQIAGLLAYDQSKKFSKHPEKYGKGEADGVIASESANNVPHFIAQSIMHNTHYNKDNLEPIANWGADPAVLIVAADSQFNTLEDLVEFAKANPGRVTVSGAGQFVGHHIATLQLERAADIELRYVPTSGGVDALRFVQGGQTLAGFNNLSDAYRARDRLKILAIAYLERDEEFFPNEVGRAHPFSSEKLSPVLTLYRARDFDAAFDRVREILEHQGAGHSCGIHTRDDDHVRRLGLEMPVCRVIVNQAHAFATGGSFDNGLPFSLSMGCGTWGKNPISENLNVNHYMNITRIARSIPPVEPTMQELFEPYWKKYGIDAN